MTAESRLDHRDSELQQMLREAVRAYANDEWPAARLLRQEREGGELTRHELARLQDMGWLAMLAPERLGGTGTTLLEAAVVVEELARSGNIVLPVVAANVAVRVLSAVGRPEFDALVRRQAAGEALHTLSEALRWDAPVAGKSITVVDGKLAGTASMVPWAHLADSIVVPVTMDAGPALAVVPLDLARVGTTPTMEAPHRHSVDLTGVPLAATVHAMADVHALADASLTALVTIGMAGLMACIARATAEYTSTRIVFGQPISQFQAARHRAMDLLLKAELTRATAYQAIWDFEREGRDRSVWLAKHWANRAVDPVTQHTHLLHGGIGVVADYPLHLATLGLIALALQGGTLPELVERLGR